MAMEKDPLFAGLTRPSMMFGIPSDAFGMMLVLQMVIFMGTRSFLTLLLFPVFYAIARVLCAKDPRTFRYLLLALQTRGRGLNRALWGASSYSPTRFRKR